MYPENGEQKEYWIVGTVSKYDAAEFQKLNLHINTLRAGDADLRF